MPKKKQKATATSSRASAACCIITDFLFLGAVSAASNASFLQNSRITHVLSIGKSPSTEVEGITYLRLGLLDDENADIKPVVNKACEFIDGAKEKKGKVLVHCSAAISRSPTVVAAHMMKRQSGAVNLRTALEALVEARDAVAPNIGFLRQLGEIEKELFGKSSVNLTAVEGKIRLKEILKRSSNINE